MKPVIAVTMGDAAGIGPEVCLKAVASGKMDFCQPVIIGSRDVLENLAAVLKLRTSINTVKNVEEIKLKRGVANLLDIGGIQSNKLIPGRTSAICGRASVNYIRKASALAANNLVDAIVTAPISKQAMHRAGLKYTGHTELLADIFRVKKIVMIFARGNLHIAIVTRHIPISEVSRSITKKGIIDTINVIYADRKLLGLSKPSFAVLSLNPHAGEGGILGKDEQKTIIPAIKKAAGDGIKVAGPFPADGFFGTKREKNFNVVIAMYHDQGLIPYKMAAFGCGVNVTLGLPIIRTSVDHGTAFDIAGKGIADPSGLTEAMRLAALMAGRKRKLGKK